ncbi:SdpA family antimicrobial peptide system protein (plasmid) [Macrococcoides bohemicum]|uniref:SdpA family antimicrobial peptide system protein n=1 Tax=Macrococcoides bohemicum TaxID=1903056 RepID=UPI003AFF6E4A
MDKRFIGVTSILVGSIFILAMLFSIFVALPNNPISSKLKLKDYISMIYPQQWGFYSKDTRDENFLILNSKTYKNGADWPNNIPSNLFGINRKGRAQGTEMGVISSSIPNEKWEKCDSEYQKCIENNKENVYKIKNYTPKPQLCGNLTFIKKPPVPWAWKRNNKDIVMPSQIVRLDIVC